jgi:hypothetical protein
VEVTWNQGNPMFAITFPLMPKVESIDPGWAIVREVVVSRRTRAKQYFMGLRIGNGQKRVVKIEPVRFNVTSQ